MPTKTKVQRVMSELMQSRDMSLEIVKQLTETAFVRVLQRDLGGDIEVSFDEEDNLHIIWYTDENGIVVPRIVDIYRLQWNTFKKIIEEMEFLVHATITMDDFKNFRPLYRTVIGGTVSSVAADDTLYIAIQSNRDGGGQALGICEFAHQTPKERGSYKLGDYLWFYTTNVEAFRQLGAPRLMIRLSRTSKSLPEKLLHLKLMEQYLGHIEVKCLRRIAGAFSLINVSEEVPRDSIKEVSDELKERIIVNRPYKE